MLNNRNTTGTNADGPTENSPTTPRNHFDAGSAVEQFPKTGADESRLIRLSQQGDGDAFAHLYDRYVDRIYRYIFFRVDDDNVTEDITSHVFMKMWEKLPTYQAGLLPLGAWLYRIAHNAVIDHYRTKKPSISLEELHSSEVAHHDRVEEKLDLKMERQQLRNALKGLTPDQQDVLVLKFIEGLSTQEVSRRLGKSEGAVRALQMRGLRELAKSPALRTRSEAYGQ